MEEGVDGVGRRGAEFGDTTVAGEAGGVTDNFSKHGVVGVLVFGDGRREDDRRAHPADDRGDGERVREGWDEVGVAAEIGEFEGGAEKRSGFLGLGGALGGGAVGAGFAAGADGEMDGAASGRFQSDDPAGAKFDVVGSTGGF